MTDRTLLVLGGGILLAFLVRSEMRMDSIEDRLDSIIQTNETVRYTKHDVECLAKNIYYEAGVEKPAGKYAVANITINRLKTGHWGNTICKVVYAPKQFSWTGKRKLEQPNPKVYAESVRIAEHSLRGARVQGLDRGLFYHAEYVRPHWVEPRETITKIGQHIFYKKSKGSTLEVI